MPAIDSTIQLRKPPPSGCDDILSTPALDFLAALAQRCEPRRRELLERRRLRQAERDAGKLPDFLPETKAIRDDAWTVAPIPPDLRDRRVEITGPVDRKMIINGLNSGANVFMADFEDANAPSWENNVVGQRNLRDAVAGTISYLSPEGKRYALAATTATLVVRPRGWHLVEKHVDVDGAPISASLFDFGLAFYDNAAALIAKGSGPYFHLPQLESHLETRPGAQHAGAREGAPGQAARGAAGTRRHLGRASRPGVRGARGVRRPHAGREPDRATARRRARHRPGPAGHPVGSDHDRGSAHQPRRGGALSRGLAGRPGVRAHQRSDGGRRHGGDLPSASLAVAAPRRAGAGRALRECRPDTDRKSVGEGKRVDFGGPRII